MPFKFTKLEIHGPVIIEYQKFYDERGYFFESCKNSNMLANGIPVDFVQDNHSISKKGVVRGLHFQLEPKAQGKLVYVTWGKVFDVALDIREGSPTYGKWISVVLSGNENKMLWIPTGFAHGFMTLEDDTILSYKVTGSEWSKVHERGVLWNDESLAIPWPLNDAILSEKDAILPPLKNVETNFVYM